MDKTNILNLKLFGAPVQSGASRYSNNTGDSLATLKQRVIDLTAKVTGIQSQLDAGYRALAVCEQYYAGDNKETQCTGKSSAAWNSCINHNVGPELQSGDWTLIGQPSDTGASKLRSYLNNTFLPQTVSALNAAKSDLTTAANEYNTALPISAKNDPVVIAALAAADKSAAMTKLKKWLGVAAIVGGGVLIFVLARYGYRLLKKSHPVAAA